MTKNDRYTLSKSRFLSGTLCHLRLWYDFHDRDLAADPGDTLQATFETGYEVGELACQLFPGGPLVAQDHLQIPEAVDETERLLAQGNVTALFEAAFENQGFLARADILERLPEGGWQMIEVKSTTNLKDVTVVDATFQVFVLRGVGLDVRCSLLSQIQLLQTYR